MVYNWRFNLTHALQHYCLLCHCPLTGNSPIFALCHYCHASLSSPDPCCQHCAEPTAIPMINCGQCLNKPPFYDQTLACTRYTEDIQALILQLKLYHNLAACRLFADLLQQALIAHPLAFDVIVPVPMHFSHELWRGNNHSRLLAKALAQRCQIPMQDNLIKKTRRTALQRSLNAKKRHSNLRQAFTATGDLTDLSIAIVDDVITTGSTINEMAKTLKQAGAKAVYALAVARA